MSQETYLYKSLRAGLRSQNNAFQWKLGQWETHSGELALCSSGFHASTRAVDAMRYVPCEILARVDVKGHGKASDDKQVWSEMQVVQAWEWTKQDSIALAVFIAELTLHLYETQHPGDDRPRKAIIAAKEWLLNPSDDRAAVAGDAARAAEAAAWAAEAAAWAAAGAAAGAAWAAAGAAWAAAGAAWAAAGAAAGAAWAAGDAVLNQVEAWIQDRIPTLKEIEDKGELT